MIFGDEDIAGAIEDLGTEAQLADGTVFTGIFRRDFQTDDMQNSKVEGKHSSLAVAATEVARLGLKKFTTVIVDGVSFHVRRIEASQTTGLSMLVLVAI